MSLFPDIDQEDELEEAMQFAAVAFLHRLEQQGRLTYCHSVNEGKRTEAEIDRLLALGMRPGQPDIETNLPGNRTLFFELKTRTGWVFPKQKERHATLRRLGYDVHVVKAGSAQECVSAIAEILRTNGVDT